jgi:hypothetical protein
MIQPPWSVNGTSSLSGRYGQADGRGALSPCNFGIQRRAASMTYRTDVAPVDTGALLLVGRR